MKKQLPIGVLLINNNHKQEIISLLDSLNRQSNLEFEVYLLNNGCLGESITSKEVDTYNFYAYIIQEDVTQSIAAALNILVRTALLHTVKGVLLLQGLWQVESDFIAKLQSLLVKEDGIWGGVYNSLGKVGFDHLHSFFGYRTFRRISTRSEGETMPVSMISSPPLYIPRNVFDQCPRFDVRYYKGMELEDFSLQASQRGWKLKVSTSLRGQRLSGKENVSHESLEAYFLGRNFLLLAYRHFPPLGLALIMFIATTITLPSLVLKQIFNPRERFRVKEYTRGVCDGLKLGFTRLAGWTNT